MVDNKQSIEISDLQDQIRKLLAQRDPQVLALIEEHKKLAILNHLQDQIGESYINLSLYHCIIDINYDRFLHFADLAKPYFDLANHRRAAYYYGNIAFCFQSHSRLPESQSSFLKAIDSMERISDLSIPETKRLASHYYNLYILFGFSDLGTLDKRYIDRALELNKLIDNKLGISYCYSAMVAEMDRQGHIEDALDYALKIIEIVTHLGDPYHLGMSYCSAGLMYAKLKEREIAFEYFSKAHAILFPNSNPQLQAGYHMEIAESYFVFGEFKEAIAHYLEAIEFFKLKANTLNLSKIYRLLSHAYKSTGQLAEALLYQEKYSQALLDSFKLDKLLAVTAAEHDHEQKQQAVETAMLKQKNEEISIYVKQLEQSNDDLKQFAHAASHDLREPVRTIVSYANLLEMRLRDKLDPEEKEYIAYLKEGGKRINEMVNGILAFSKVNNSMDVSDIDLNDVFHKVIENIKLSITAKKAVVECPALPTIKGSSTLLIQLFQNLISNGIKYNESEVPSILISYSRNVNMYEFRVSDNGIGIDDKHRDDVFDIFTRLHNREQYQGTGIGLSVCRKIVERMGGRIWNERNSKGGTDFIFLLPQ